MIIFITAKPEHPTKQQIIATFKKMDAAYRIIDPSTSWVTLKRILESSNQPIILIAPDSLRAFKLCHHLITYGFEIINPPKTILLCRNRIPISEKLVNLLSEFKKEHAKANIQIPKTRYYKNKTVLSRSTEIEFPIVIKYPINHSGTHYVELIDNKSQIDGIPDWFDKTGIYVEQYIDAQDSLFKCYRLGNSVITQIDSHELTLLNENRIRIITRTSNKERKSIDTPEILREFILFVAKRLPIDIFGVDFILSFDNEYWLVDFNDFPGFRGIKDAGALIATFIMKKKENIAK